jgi:hypothetical protein
LERWAACWWRAQQHRCALIYTVCDNIVCLVMFLLLHGCSNGINNACAAEPATWNALTPQPVVVLHSCHALKACFKNIARSHTRASEACKTLAGSAYWCIQPSITQRLTSMAVLLLAEGVHETVGRVPPRLLADATSPPASPCERMPRSWEAMAAAMSKHEAAAAQVSAALLLLRSAACFISSAGACAEASFATSFAHRPNTQCATWPQRHRRHSKVVHHMPWYRGSQK